MSPGAGTELPPFSGIGSVHRRDRRWPVAGVRLQPEAVVVAVAVAVAATRVSPGPPIPGETRRKTRSLWDGVGSGGRLHCGRRWRGGGKGDGWSRVQGQVAGVTREETRWTRRRWQR